MAEVESIHDGHALDLGEGGSGEADDDGESNDERLHERFLSGVILNDVDLRSLLEYFSKHPGGRGGRHP